MTETTEQTLLPDKCPICGEVVRNDMALVRDNQGRRIAGHVQFACNYEVEIQMTDKQVGQPNVLRSCRKGQIWPKRG